MIDTLVSRSLATNFSEIIGLPTPLELQVPITTIAALVIGTTKTLSSSVALLEPPRIVTPTLEALATETETFVDPLPTKIALKP